MKNSINLVSKKRKPSKFHKRFLITSIAFFSIIFVVSVGFIGYRFFLQSEAGDLKTEESRLIAIVNQDLDKKSKFLTVRERLSEIQKIINQRKNLNSKIESASNVIPSDVEVTLVDGTEEKIKLRVTAKNLVSLDSLIEKRIAEYANDKKKGIKRVEMTSFGLNPESLQYFANFVIEFI